MTKRTEHEVLNQIALVVGFVTVALVAAALIVAIVYALIGSFTAQGIHLLATALIFVLLFGLPLAYALGVREGKAHRAGMEHGIDLKLGARERAVQRTTEPDPSVRPMLPAKSLERPDWESIRPDIYVSTNGGGDEPIEM